METIKVGINGFGRIGKCTFLQLLENPKFEIKVVNTFLLIPSKDILIEIPVIIVNNIK